MTEKGSSATRPVSKPYTVYMRLSNQASLVVQMLYSDTIHLKNQYSRISIMETNCAVQ